MSMPVLIVKQLSVSLPTATGTFQILDNINFALSPQTLTAIVGESGCGKTTLCKTLLGLLNPKFKIEGNLTLTNAAGTTMSFDLNEPDELNAIRGRRIGLLFQEPTSTLNPVLKIGRQLSDALLVPDQKECINLLEQVGFDEPDRITCSYPHELSGGQAQRAALALALAGRPEILIVDEPATALDSIAREEFFNLMHQLQTSSGSTVLMVTHDWRFLAKMAAQLIVMHSGRIVETGSPQAILGQPAHPYTRKLLEIQRAIRLGQWPEEVLLSNDKCS